MNEIKMLERIRERIMELDTHLGLGSRETKTGKVIIKDIKLVAMDEVLEIIKVEQNINKLSEEGREK